MNSTTGISAAIARDAQRSTFDGALCGIATASPEPSAEAGRAVGLAPARGRQAGADWDGPEQDNLRAQVAELQRSRAELERRLADALAGASAAAVEQARIGARLRDRSAQRATVARQQAREAQDAARKAHDEARRLRDEAARARERAGQASARAEAAERRHERDRSTLERALAYAIKLRGPDAAPPSPWRAILRRRDGVDLLIREADESRNARRYRDAAELYLRVLAVQPDNGPIHVQCGHMLKEAGDYGRAELHYLCAEVLMPEDDDLALQLGHFYKVSGRAEEAVAFYRRAEKLRPGWSEPLRELAALGEVPWAE